MKRIIKLNILFLFCAFSCIPKTLDPKEIYDLYRRSVVLIKNEYFFKLTFKNGIELFFIIENNEPIIMADKEEAIQKSMVSFGTGFFIDGNGKIATNSHVVFPTANQIDIGQNISTHFAEARNKIRGEIIEAKSLLTKIAEYYQEYQNVLGYEEKEELIEKHEVTEKKLMELEIVYNLLNFQENEYTLTIERVSLGIVYDDTFIENDLDFQGCMPLENSRSEDIDLAIIQLKNKKTPSDIKFFDINTLSEKHDLNLNDDVHMIGYNRGLGLALTEEGIKSQFNSGKITQDITRTQVLYSIPSLPGSSGSPIFNSLGRLVAINFASVTNSQGFNFGVPASHLLSLYNEKPGFSNELKKSTSTSETGVPKSSFNDDKVPVDFTTTIKEFIESEDDQNFSKIINFFSDDVIKYWELRYPTGDEIYEHYQKSWSLIEEPINNIEKIEKLDDYNYLVFTIFSFYHIEKKEYRKIQSKLRFRFDETGKIIEIFGE
ncbi:S1 family peptidase [Cognataquiflexum rubidum]|uniref:S1 family peptidase n=1 Tax=Cognataquiflexum rubidum TaxID=2922273 RepID=UPI001F14241A|nr:serine protease [Cognataquiflexum rubidum]